MSGRRINTWTYQDDEQGDVEIEVYLDDTGDQRSGCYLRAVAPSLPVDATGTDLNQLYDAIVEKIRALRQKEWAPTLLVRTALTFGRACDRPADWHSSPLGWTFEVEHASVKPPPDGQTQKPGVELYYCLRYEHGVSSTMRADLNYTDRDEDSAGTSAAAFDSAEHRIAVELLRVQLVGLLTEVQDMLSPRHLQATLDRILSGELQLSLSTKTR